MTDWCRWLGASCLVFGTLAFVLQQPAMAIAGGCLSIAWYLASYVAAAIEHQQRQRDQQDPP